jgi:hypothetical protein
MLEAHLVCLFLLWIFSATAGAFCAGTGDLGTALVPSSVSELLLCQIQRPSVTTFTIARLRARAGHREKVLLLSSS